MTFKSRPVLTLLLGKGKMFWGPFYLIYLFTKITNKIMFLKVVFQSFCWKTAGHGMCVKLSCDSRFQRASQLSFSIYQRPSFHWLIEKLAFNTMQFQISKLYYNIVRVIKLLKEEFQYRISEPNMPFNSFKSIFVWK